ncbi:MFS transporter [Gammaproteobacteria bacterium]|nr:MFS transporter [Gammaproteobacteria bacterium]
MKKISANKNYKTYLAYFVAALFLFYEMCLQVTPSVMAPAIMAELKIGASELGWIGGLYFIAYTAMQIPAGHLFDRKQYGYVFLASIIACVIGIRLFSPFLPYAALASSRVLMGIGSAFAFVSVLVVANRLFPKQHYPLLVGIAQLLAAFGAMLGGGPVSYLMNTAGIDTTLMSLVLFGLALTFMSFIFLCQPLKNQLQVEKNKSPTSLLANLKSIITNKQTLWIGLYACLSWTPVACFAELWGPTYLAEYHHISITMASSVTSGVWVGLMIGSPCIGLLSLKINLKWLTATTAFIGFLSSFCLLHIYMPLISSYILLFFIGVSSSGQILTFEMIRKLHKSNSLHATATGINNMALVAGGIIFQPLIGHVLSAMAQPEWIHQIPHYPVPSYQIALSVIPACYLLAFIIALTRFNR